MALLTHPLVINQSCSVQGFLCCRSPPPRTSRYLRNQALHLLTVITICEQFHQLRLPLCRDFPWNAERFSLAAPNSRLLIQILQIPSAGNHIVRRHCWTKEERKVRYTRRIPRRRAILNSLGGLRLPVSVSWYWQVRRAIRRAISQDNW